MASKRGLKERLAERVRRRQEKPRPLVVATGNVRSDRWHEITRSHEDVLQNIEFVLADCWRRDDTIDDAAVHAALVATMRKDPPPPEKEAQRVILARLIEVRSLREDVDDELWLDALRVVDQSVRDHSSLRVGDRSYLEFMWDYIELAMGEGEEYRIVEARLPRRETPHDAG